MAELLYKKGELEARLESSHSIVHHDLLFFHSNEFIKRNKDSNPLFFNLYVEEKNLASIVFEEIEGIAISLPRSPFGGLIIGDIIDQETLEEFHNYIIAYLKDKNCPVEIRLAPTIYSSDEPNYLDARLEIIYIENNQHIPIDRIKFSDKLNRNRKRKLELNIHQGYKFKRLEIEQLDQAYELIRECRIDKGYPVTMSIDALKKTFTSFPDRYLLFGVFDGSELIATAVSIRVSESTLYNFYHGDRLSYRGSGPVTLLVAGIYEYCQEHGIEILDLGISSQHGKLNEGLFYFKRSCGAVSSDKISYQLKA